MNILNEDTPIELNPRAMQMYAEVAKVRGVDGVTTREQPMSSLNKQEGGGHYKQFKIQPIEYITANELGYMDGNVIKYISRHRFKNGAEDVRKIIHYCELILELEYGCEDTMAKSKVPSDKPMEHLVDRGWEG